MSGGVGASPPAGPTRPALDQLVEQLGLERPGSGLPLARLDGRPVTVAARLGARALDVAARRGTPLVVAQAGEDDDPVPDLTVVGLASPDGASPDGARAGGEPASGGRARPWPVVVASDSPWAVAGADLGLLVGEEGPADHDGLAPSEAAALIRRFLDRSFDGPPAEPVAPGSLLDIVPFAIDGPYDVDALLAALVDDGGWVELAAGAAPEVVTVVARLGGRSVGIAASRPGHDGGRLGPAGWARVERLLDWCERGDRPFVALVDTAGTLTPATGADQAALARVAARIRAAEVTKLAVVVGRAVGLGATVLGAVGARADLVLPWPRARFSLTPPPADLPPAEVARRTAADRAATEGDVLDVVHPDETRDRLVELLDLLRGRRELAR